MKAAYYTKYGTPDVIELKEIEIPSPKGNEVLVEVYSASINSWDWDLIRGKPYLVRMWGLFKPKNNIPGGDIAGIVEAVGSGVKKFKPGDKVFGDLCASGWGGFAEYAAVPEKALELIPGNLSFEEAASIPQAGVLAAQAVFDYKQITPGQKVLVNGAGGGVGTFTLQMAKLSGAEVTCVDKSSKLDKLVSLGADKVIDFEQENFTKSGKQYDLIIDASARYSSSDYKRALADGGIYLMIGGKTSSILNIMVMGSLVSDKSKKIKLLPHQPNKYLLRVAGLIESGKIKATIDKKFNLTQVKEAFEYYGRNEFSGKIIIKIAE